MPSSKIEVSKETLSQGRKEEDRRKEERVKREREAPPMVFGSETRKVFHRIVLE